MCCIVVCSGDVADLIFVFFDPIGQALCKRTLSLVEQLNGKHAERMRFYLSKADEAGHEADRQVTLIHCSFVMFILTGFIIYFCSMCTAAYDFYILRLWICPPVRWDLFCSI